MNHTITCILGIAIAAVLYCATGASAQLADNSSTAIKPEMKDWRNWSVPVLGDYARITVRPADSEFLKLLPPLRTPPKFDAATHQRGVAAWWGDCSVPFFSEQPPTRQEVSKKLVVKTTAGEIEPLILGLWGIKDVGQVTLDPRRCPFPVTARVVEFRPRKAPGDYNGDSVKGARTVGFSSYLPKANAAEVKQDQNTVFWLQVSIPSDTKPGKYNASVSLTLSGSGQTVEAPFAIDVLDFTLPPAKAAFGMYFRPVADEFLPAAYRTPEMMRLYWRDMAEHGMTSATLYNSSGNLYNEENKAIFEGHPDVRTIKDMMADGLVRKDIPIMLLGRMTPEAAPNVVAEAKRQGFPELLFYGPDEPVPGDKNAEDHWKSIQPVRKHMRLVTACADHGAVAFSDLFDVWAVSGGRITPDLLKLCRDKKAEMWTYDCNSQAFGSSTYHRFYAGLYMWAYGITGNFLWCYTEGYTWEGNKGGRFCYVLPSLDGPVPSVQWEARREGTKDYRTMSYLESLIAANPNTAKAREAKAWVNSIRAKTDWYLARNMPPCLDPIDGVGLYPLCQSFKPEELQPVRERAEAYILALKK